MSTRMSRRLVRRLVLVLGGLPYTKPLQELYAALDAALQNDASRAHVIVVDVEPRFGIPDTFKFVQKDYNDYLTPETVLQMRKNYDAIAVVDELLWWDDKAKIAAKQVSCLTPGGPLNLLCELVKENTKAHTWWRRRIGHGIGGPSTFERLSNAIVRGESFKACVCADIAVMAVKKHTTGRLKTLTLPSAGDVMESLFDTAPIDDARGSADGTIGVLRSLRVTASR